MDLQKFFSVMRFNPIFISWAWLASAGLGGATAVAQVGGTLGAWPTAWTALGNSTAEINNGLANPNMDLVGNSTNPGMYYAMSSSYVFFRMRVDGDTFTVGNGSYFALIDVVGSGRDGIDFGFAWDAKSNNTATHGLEMTQYYSTTNGTWAKTDMNDVDGVSGSKGVKDINGNGRTGEGYVRTDQETTTAFGITTLIDFAVSWSYLQQHSTTGLDARQTWMVTAATVLNQTDHGWLDGDVMGGEPTDLVAGSTAWSSGFTTVPEPSTALGGLLLGAGLLRRRR